MKLSGKLMIAPLVAIGFLVALGVASYYSLTVQQRAADAFYEGVFGRYKTVVSVEASVGGVQAGIYRLLSISEAIDSDRLAKESGEFKQRLVEAQKSLTELANRATDGKAAIQAAADKLADYAKAADLAVELGKAKGSFWQDYKFTNPVTKKIEPKQMYCERLDEVVVCGGIYK